MRSTSMAPLVGRALIAVLLASAGLGGPAVAVARAQAATTASMPFVTPHLALMPDAHLGMGATVGSVIPTDVDIVLTVEPGFELEGKNRLARIGFDRVIGYLEQPYKVMFQHRDDVEVASRLTAKLAFPMARLSSAASVSMACPPLSSGSAG